MARDRLQGFILFLKSLDMRGSYEIKEVPRKSCRKKLVFPSPQLNSATLVCATTDEGEDTDDDYNLFVPTASPSQTSINSQSEVDAENRKRPVSLPLPEANADDKNDQEPPRKRLRFQEFICVTCNGKFNSQSELDDHKISCVIDIICEQSGSPEISFMSH